ncbi:MAG: hypothetical protein ACKOPU_05540 [Candidatus Planktophila sp.]
MSDYSKLTIESDASAGSFVRTLQGATGKGFQDGTHVHKDWWAKTKTFEQVMQDTQTAIDNREDILAETKSISCVSENDDFYFKLGDGRKFRPTDHAIEQFSTRTGVTSSSFLREMRNIEGFDSHDANTMAIVGNNALRRVDQDKKFRLRTYTDGTCRAFVTEQYAPVDNRWYLEVLQEFIPGGRFSHWRGDEDTIYGNVLIPDTIMDYGSDDSDYGGMISVGNCEIGTRRITQTPSLFRAICMNGCIWGQTAGEKIRRVHRGNIDLAELKLEIAKNIQDQIPLLAPGIKKFLETRAMEIGKASAKGIIASVSSDYKLTKREATEFLEQYITMEAQNSNLFGIINGLTRAGQKFDNKTWVKFDEVAGSLLDTSADRWATILRRADTFSDKDYEKVFALTA